MRKRVHEKSDKTFVAVMRKFQHMATLKFAWMQFIGSLWIDTTVVGQHAWLAFRVITWHPWFGIYCGASHVCSLVGTSLFDATHRPTFDWHHSCWTACLAGLYNDYLASLVRHLSWCFPRLCSCRHFIVRKHTCHCFRVFDWYRSAVATTLHDSALIHAYQTRAIA